LVLDGTDNMGWKPKISCIKPSGEYDRETNAHFFEDDPATWIKTKSGSFVIFFPKDAHIPLISSGPLHKVVIKVAIK
jgi:biofilm protein TabA